MYYEWVNFYPNGQYEAQYVFYILDSQIISYWLVPGSQAEEQLNVS